MFIYYRILYSIQKLNATALSKEEFAEEIIDNLEAGLNSFREILGDLNKAGQK